MWVNVYHQRLTSTQKESLFGTQMTYGDWFRCSLTRQNCWGLFLELNLRPYERGACKLPLRHPAVSYDQDGDRNSFWFDFPWRGMSGCRLLISLGTRVVADRVVQTGGVRTDSQGWRNDVVEQLHNAIVRAFQRGQWFEVGTYNCCNKN